MRKLFLTALCALMNVCAWAYTDEPMSVTWTMADGASSTAVASPSGTISSPNWSYGSAVALNSSATATVFAGKTVENVYTLFTRVGEDKLANTRSKLDNSYVEFAFTPEAGLTFTPTALELDVVKLGTGDPSIFVEIIQGSTTTAMSVDAIAIARDNDAEPAPHLSYDLSSFPAIVATTGATAVRIYIGKLANTKQVGIADVVISGTVSGEKSTEYTVTFSKGETEALGTAPEPVTASSVTMPVNKSLFKDGYTLTGWTDGVTTYAIGAVFSPEANTTLTPVFTANTFTLAQSLSELTVRWDFQRANGCPATQWEGRTGDMFIQQVSINGKSTDVMLEVNTNNGGKFNNASWTDWCQVNEGTTFVFASAAGATVKAFTYGEPKNDSDEKSAVDGNEYSAYASNVATFATTPVDGRSTMTVKGGSYYRYIDITYPADESALPLKALTVDGVAMDGAVLAAINAAPAYDATFAGNIYTTVPAVEATMMDNAKVAGVPSGTGTSRAYTISSDPYTFTLNVEGIHVYEPTGDEEAANIKNGEGTIENNVWSNGIYTLSGSMDVSSNGKFKLNAKEYTLTVPAGVIVKQLIIKDFSNNYAGNTNDHLVSVTSEGATAYVPTKNNCWHSSEGDSYDLVVTVDDHTAGAPLTITFSQRTGQPLGWFQLTVIKTNPGIAPIKTAENVAIDDNDAVVAVSFDRELVKDVTATINGADVTAKGGVATLYFSVWDLPYNHNYTLTIPAETVEDSYGNKNESPIEIAVNIPAKTAVTATEYDYVVSNATELDDALEELKASNRTANAARKTVFLKNGNYTYGTLDGNYQYNVSLKIDNWNNIHNVSFIGESKNGVIIEGTTTGITSATLNLGDGEGIYLQDLTVRNNFDFHSGEFKGVSVAILGGNKAVLKNVAMQANQDTYVTGKRTYLNGCDIYGTVDFICGGGDIFFDLCNLILCNRASNYIVAPNTNPETQWGYVFDHCIVKADEGAETTVEGTYYLGRPWQNEPRSYFLYTKMEVLCKPEGWAAMSGEKPTHFYEYQSYDKENQLVDLSTRQNSPSSTNHYSPILSADSAALFTSHNVLGGTDAWDAASKAAQMSAPELSLDNNVLSWNAIDDALLYVVLKDGEYVVNTTGTSLNLTESGDYSVKAANRFGGLGAASATKKYTATATDIDQIVNGKCENGKFIKNGQMFILRDGKTYNVLGAEIK